LLYRRAATTNRICLRELGAGIGLYLVLLFGTVVAVHRWPLHGGMLVALLLLPMHPFAVWLMKAVYWIIGVVFARHRYR
jgi:hypothetical protein